MLIDRVEITNNVHKIRSVMENIVAEIAEHKRQYNEAKDEFQKQTGDQTAAAKRKVSELLRQRQTKLAEKRYRKHKVLCARLNATTIQNDRDKLLWLAAARSIRLKKGRKRQSGQADKPQSKDRDEIQ